MEVYKNLLGLQCEGRERPTSHTHHSKLFGTWQKTHPSIYTNGHNSEKRSP